ncbi:Uncharacterized protein GBIM_21673, partial [Gryllus bimaculatus]
VLPVGMWSKFPKASFNNLTLYLRGKGAATLALLKAPGAAFDLHIVRQKHEMAEADGICKLGY